MGLKLKNVTDQVIVITGASSGIGLATAELAAKRGARVVLNARSEHDLRQVCDRIRAGGGRATYYAGDVANADAMQALARTAIQEFGGFDTWVNDAGISVYGRLTEVPLEDKRRVFDVNFWGVVHGCRAAVPHLRERGGAIINIGSEVSDRAIPLQGIYSASKHAVKAYTDALRMELEEQNAPVSVSLVKPAPPIRCSSITRAAIWTRIRTCRRRLRARGSGLRDSAVRRTAVPRRHRRRHDEDERLMGVLAPRMTDYYMERKLFNAQKKDYQTGGQTRCMNQRMMARAEDQPRGAKCGARR
jgi:NAD(P)-dependent dehydrogenase (short-subunit alcohol dehydrogenase family)